MSDMPPAPCATIDTLRRRGIGVLAICGWAATLVIALIDGLLGGPAWPMLLLGAVANLGPTLVALRRRHDGEARLITGTLAAVLPAMLVYVFRGHGWQMDAHMYFFVALGALAMLCDWRPIALASGLIAIHHLTLEFVAPQWVFAGLGNIDRVLFHAVAVVAQCAVLSAITARLARLLDAQDAAVATSTRLVAAADAERRRAGAALAAATEAQAHADRARREARALDLRHAELRREEMLALAADFERSVAGIAISIEAAAVQLEASAGQMDDVSAAAAVEARTVAVNAMDATGETRRVAEAIAELGSSIGSVAAAADQQRALTALGCERGAHSSAAVAELAERAEQIGGLIEAIRGIAAKTNILALNATIEASRAGDAGRGFAVVAHEVKLLAAEAAEASAQVVGLLDTIRAGIETAREDAAMVTTAVGEVMQAAVSIASDAADQRLLAGSIEQSAMRAAGNADTIERRIDDLAASVAETETLSTEVRDSARALLHSARDLRGSSERFVRHLRDEPAPGEMARAA